MKDGTYVINFDEYKSIGTYWIVLYVNGDTGVYSSANWPPFTGGQNSILNWVSKLNPMNQKIKK